MKRLVEKYFQQGGIQLNGPHPWDIQILNDKFYQKVIAQGSLGMGEAYMDGWWEAQQIICIKNKSLPGMKFGKVCKPLY
jgi:cyclopropane-fatty-acyl-phospholipid synthase